MYIIFICSDQSRTDGGFFNSQNEFGNVTNTPNQRQKSVRIRFTEYFYKYPFITNSFKTNPLIIRCHL